MQISSEFVSKYWDIRECVLLRGTDPEAVSLVDMRIQSTVVTGPTVEVYQFCLSYATQDDLQYLFGMDLEDLEAGSFGSN